MAMISCKKCGKEISDEALACPNCGAPLSPDGIVKIEHQTHVDLSKRYRQTLIKTKLCGHCKAEIPADAKICPKCHRKSSKYTGFKIVSFLFFSFLAYSSISQRDAVGGENNIYFGIACLVLAMISLLSIIFKRGKSQKPVEIIQTTNATFSKDTYSSLEQENNLLPNGKTIAKQRQIDYQIALGNYPDDTPVYCDMRIASSTVPPSPDYAQLNDDEKIFFSTLSAKLIESGYRPDRIRLTRLSDGTFNIDHIDLCYIGKIRLYKAPDSYAVIKKGNKKATRIFSDYEQAKKFAAQNSNYEIRTRSTPNSTYMQYSIGLNTTKHMHDPSLQQCLDAIPKWIRYLNYCKKNEK